MEIDDKLYINYLKNRNELTKNIIYPFFKKELDRILLITSDFDDGYIKKIIDAIKNFSPSIIKDISVKTVKIEKLNELISALNDALRFAPNSTRFIFEKKYAKGLGVSLVGKLETIIYSIIIVYCFEILKDIKGIQTSIIDILKPILQLESHLTYSSIKDTIDDDCKSIISAKNSKNGKKQTYKFKKKLLSELVKSHNNIYPADMQKHDCKINYLQEHYHICKNTADKYYKFIKGCSEVYPELYYENAENLSPNKIFQLSKKYGISPNIIFNLFVLIKKRVPITG